SCRLGCGSRGLRRRNGRNRIRRTGGISAGPRLRVWCRILVGGHISCRRFRYHSGGRPCGPAPGPGTQTEFCGSLIRIKEIRTRVMRWRGKTVPLPPHFCTNPMDLLSLPEATMQTFAFHGWLVVEVFTDEGVVGIGNAALAPQVTKQVIDLHLKPLLIGKDPWDIEFLWQHMYRKTMAFGRRGIGM